MKEQNKSLPNASWIWKVFFVLVQTPQQQAVVAELAPLHVQESGRFILCAVLDCDSGCCCCCAFNQNYEVITHVHTGDLTHRSCTFAQLTRFVQRSVLSTLALDFCLCLWKITNTQRKVSPNGVRQSRSVRSNRGIYIHVETNNMLFE